HDAQDDRDDDAERRCRGKGLQDGRPGLPAVSGRVPNPDEVYERQGEGRDEQDEEEMRGPREVRHAGPRSAFLRPRAFLAQLRVSRREPSDRDPERRARDVVQADPVTELDACRIPAMFAADPDLEIPPDLATLLHAHPHELADAGAVDRLERIVREDALLDVVQEELRLRVIPAVPHRRLGEVIRPEREEFRMAGDFVGDESGPRNLDHRAELVGDRDPLAFHHLPRLILQGVSFDPQLLGKTYQWDHDFRPNVDAFSLAPARRLQDGPD